MTTKNQTSLLIEKHKKNKLSKEEKKQIKLDNKNKIGLNQFIKPILFLVLAIILEIVNYSILGFKISGTNNTQLFPTYIFFDFGFWLMICALMLSTSKKWLANIYFYVFLLLQLIFCILNASLYKDFGYLFTWDMINLAVEALNAFDPSFVDFKSVSLYICLFALFIALPIIVDIIFYRKKFVLNKLSKPIFCLILFFICFSTGLTCYTVQPYTINQGNLEFEEIESDRYLYKNMHIREEAFKKFGTWGFYIQNFYDFAIAKYSNKDKKEILTEISSSIVKKNINAPLYNDNLIIIMMESFEWFAIDPYCTPNLWKLKTGENLTETYVPSPGIVMNSYYANNKTNVSEDVALLGYMPNVNTYHVEGTDTIATAFSLPNLFNNQDYATSYFHAWDESFYDRGTTNLNIGFDNLYMLSDFTHKDKSTQFNQFNLEADFVDQFINQIAPTDKKFMSFYTTVSTHGGYGSENYRFNDYYEIYDDNLQNIKTWLTSNGYVYPENTQDQIYLRNYKASAIDTDVAIGKIFKHLEQNNLIDSTTIIIYSDHNTYFNDLSYTIKGTEKSDISSLTNYNIPFMIYSSKLNAQTKTEFCNTYDIYPTICNLFGLEYCTLFAQGKNMFSSDILQSTYISYLTGYYNEKCYSKNMRNIKTRKNATQEEIDFFKNNVCEFYKKQERLEKIYARGWKIKDLI